MKRVFKDLFNNIFIYLKKNKVKFYTYYLKMAMLTDDPRAMINNLFQESFDTIFMGNEKSCQNIN